MAKMMKFNMLFLCFKSTSDSNIKPATFLINFLSNFADCYHGTVNFLNIRTPKKFVVITLKFELCGSTIE